MHFRGRFLITQGGDGPSVLILEATPRRIIYLAISPIFSVPSFSSSYLLKSQPPTYNSFLAGPPSLTILWLPGVISAPNNPDRYPNLNAIVTTGTPSCNHNGVCHVLHWLTPSQPSTYKIADQCGTSVIALAATYPRTTFRSVEYSMMTRVNMVIMNM